MSDPAPPVPDLTTERLVLRRLTIEDAPAAHQAYGDPGAMRYWDALPSVDLAETRHRLQRSLAADPQYHATWAIRADDQFIGMINYHARQTWNRRLAIGWILVPRFQRHGYMREAATAVLSHCFTALDTHRVEAEIEPENPRSARLATSLGFQREGLLRDRILVAGQPRTMQMFALLRPDWPADPYTTSR